MVTLKLELKKQQKKWKNLIYAIVQPGCDLIEPLSNSIGTSNV